MAKFGVSFGSFATTTGVLTALKLVSATKIPWEIVELGMYGGGIVAPADIQHQATFAYVSAAGAGTGTASPPTPEPLSKTSAVSGLTVLWKMTAEPTTYARSSPCSSASTSAAECVGPFRRARVSRTSSRRPRCTAAFACSRLPLERWTE